MVAKLQIMLGQLAANIKCLNHPGDKFQDQEVVIIGMHGHFFHIMRGFFYAKDISAVQLGLDKERHTFRVDLSKDYNLLVKEEFLEAVRGLVGIFRYFLSGEAKVGAIQRAFS